MNIKLSQFCSILLCTLLASAPVAPLTANTSRIQDESFEFKLPADQGGWTLFKDSSFSSKQARSGSRSIFNWGFSRTVQYHPFLLGNVSGSFQEFSASPDSRWRLIGYGMTPIALQGAPSFGIVQVSFFDAQGKDLGTVETADGKTPRAKISNEVNSQSPVGEWILLDTGIATAPAGTATVQVFTLYVDYSGSNTSQGVYFDDLVLCAVGEDTDSACN